MHSSMPLLFAVIKHEKHSKKFSKQYFMLKSLQVFLGFLSRQNCKKAIVKAFVDIFLITPESTKNSKLYLGTESWWIHALEWKYVSVHIHPFWLKKGVFTPL